MLVDCIVIEDFHCAWCASLPSAETEGDKAKNDKHEGCTVVPQLWQYTQDLYSNCLQFSFTCDVCWQDGSGRVDLETLKDGELDYGCDQAGLADLRQRTRTAVHNYEGAPASSHNCQQ